MCANCAATGAVAATAAATGARVWLAAHAPAWVSPRVTKAAGAVAIAGGVLAAGVLA